MKKNLGTRGAITTEPVQEENDESEFVAGVTWFSNHRRLYNTMYTIVNCVHRGIFEVFFEVLTRNRILRFGHVTEPNCPDPDPS
jgi:hypothetical protein